MNQTTTPAALDLDKLEALARAATPGPWEGSYGDGVCGDRAAAAVSWDLTDVRSMPVRKDDQVVAWLASYKPDNVELDSLKADAEFIAAANPATILALIDLARRSSSAAGSEPDERALK